MVEVVADELRWKLLRRGRLAPAYNRGCSRPGGAYEIAPGDSLRQRWRVLAHDGADPTAAYRAWAAGI